MFYLELSAFRLIQFIFSYNIVFILLRMTNSSPFSLFSTKVIIRSFNFFSSFWKKNAKISKKNFDKFSSPRVILEHL
jgi:hypothetical protein